MSKRLLARHNVFVDDFSFRCLDQIKIPTADLKEGVALQVADSEAVKLQSAYEQALYGIQHIRSSNGYEQRRLSAIAFGDKGIKAAAAASAIVAGVYGVRCLLPVLGNKFGAWVPQPVGSVPFVSAHLL